MLRVSLSDNMLITVFLPGAIVFLALCALIFPSVVPPTIKFVVRIQSNASTTTPGWPVLATGLIALTVLFGYLASVFLGSLVAIIVGYLEGYVLDKWRVKELKIDLKEYIRQWECYIDRLEEAHNTYVTRQVTSFMFEIRSAIAFLILALVLVMSSVFPWWSSFVAFILAVLLGLAANADHSALADFRNRRFSLVDTCGASSMASAGSPSWVMGVRSMDSCFQLNQTIK